LQSCIAMEYMDPLIRLYISCWTPKTVAQPHDVEGTCRSFAQLTINGITGHSRRLDQASARRRKPQPGKLPTAAIRQLCRSRYRQLLADRGRSLCRRPRSRNRAAVAHRVRARMARCSTRGPCAAVSRGRQAAQREPTWMSAPFRQGRMPCRKARPRLTDLPDRMPGKRQAGWPSLLVIFLLATQEKSDSAAAGRRKLLLWMQQEHRAQHTGC